MPPPEDVPALESKHLPPGFLLGIEPPPLGPTPEEKRILHRVWDAVQDIARLDPVLPDL